MALASRLPSSEVALVAPAATATALPSDRQLGRRTILALAAVAGLMVGVAGAFAIECLSPESPAVAIPWTGPARRVWRRRRGNGTGDRPSDRSAAKGPSQG